MQPLLFTLDEGNILMVTPADLEPEVAALGPPATMQPPLPGWRFLLSAAATDVRLW